MQSQRERENQNPNQPSASSTMEPAAGGRTPATDRRCPDIASAQRSVHHFPVSYRYLTFF